MADAFAGTLLLPDEEGSGLDAVLETVDTDIKLLTGDQELGSWSQDECEVTPAGDGAFRVALGDEVVLFVPDAPHQFANLMTNEEPPSAATPLKVRIEAQTSGAPTGRAKPAKIEPLKSVGKVEVLGRGMTALIVGVSSILIVALVVLSSSL